MEKSLYCAVSAFIGRYFVAEPVWIAAGRLSFETGCKRTFGAARVSYRGAEPV